MQFNSKISLLIAVVLAVLLSVFLFFRGKNNNQGVLKPIAVVNNEAILNPDTFLQSVKIDNPLLKELVSKFPLKLEISAADTFQLRKIAVLADSLRIPVIGRLYLQKLAFFKDNEKEIAQVGREFIFLGSSQNGDEKQFILCMQQGNICLQKVLDKNPNNIEARNARSIYLFLFRREQEPMAPAMYTMETLKIDSNNVEAIGIMANLSLESGQIEKAINRFQKLISLQPQNPEYYFSLSELYGKTNNPVEAKKYLELAKKIQTSNNNKSN